MPKYGSRYDNSLQTFGNSAQSSPDWMNSSSHKRTRHQENKWDSIMKQAQDFDKERTKRKNPFFKEKAKRKIKKKKIVIERETRDKGLQQPIPETNKGFQMLAKLGYKQGQQLGKTRKGITVPVKISRIREKNEGLGSGVNPADFPKLNLKMIEEYRERHRQRYHALESKPASSSLVEKARAKCNELESNAAVTANVKTKSAEGFNHDEVPISEFEMVGGINYVGMVAEMCQKLRIEKPSLSFDKCNTSVDGNPVWRCGLSILINNNPFQCQSASKTKKVAKKMAHAVLLQRICGTKNLELQNHVQAFNYKKCFRLDHLVDYLRTRHFHCFWCETTYQSHVEMQTHCPGPDRALHPGFEVFDDAEIKRSVNFRFEAFP